MDALQQVSDFLGLSLDICSDCTKTEMEHLLQSYAEKEDMSGYDIFMCFILSHGEKGAIHTSDGQIIELEYIRQMFIKSKQLHGKPKFFIIQACQGANISQTTGVQADSGPDPTQIFQPEVTVFADGDEDIPVESDIMMLVATTPGKMLLLIKY